jgi:hypothetical protein
LEKLIIKLAFIEIGIRKSGIEAENNHSIIKNFECDKLKERK